MSPPPLMQGDEIGAGGRSGEKGPGQRPAPGMGWVALATSGGKADEEVQASSQDPPQAPVSNASGERPEPQLHYYMLTHEYEEP